MNKTSKKAHVTVSKNGPYLVTGSIRLSKQTHLARTRKVVLKPGSSLTPIQCKSPMRFAGAADQRRSRYAMARTPRSDSTARKRPVGSRSKGKPKFRTAPRCNCSMRKPCARLRDSVIQTGRSGTRWIKLRARVYVQRLFARLAIVRVVAWWREMD